MDESGMLERIAWSLSEKEIPAGDREDAPGFGGEAGGVGLRTGFVGQK
jgi:hypothetical protein